jgi:hypothetical protein
MRFDEYYFTEDIWKNFIDFIKKSFDKITQMVKNIFPSLNFGETKTVSLQVENIQTENENPAPDGKDLKSRLGYYVERCATVVLCENLYENGFTLHRDTLLEELRKEKQRYLNEKILKDFEKDEILQSLKISETNAKALGEKLFNEIASSEDCAICKYDFDVQLTGEEMKFKNKADLIVTKFDKQTVVKQIFASLKSYTSWNINLVNATFISFVKKLLFPHIEGKGSAFIDNLLIGVENGTVSKEAKQVLNRMKEVSSLASDFVKYKDMWKKEGKSDYRNKATELMKSPIKGDKSRFYIISEFVIEVFDVMYKNHKDDINKNFLKIIDLEAEEMYIAVASKRKTSILSTKISKKFQELVKNLQNDFTIKMVRVSSSSFNLLILSNDGTTLLTFNVPLKEEGKVNLWLNFKEFLEKED